MHEKKLSAKNLQRRIRDCSSAGRGKLGGGGGRGNSAILMTECNVSTSKIDTPCERHQALYEKEPARTGGLTIRGFRSLDSSMKDKHASKFHYLEPLPEQLIGITRSTNI